MIQGKIKRKLYFRIFRFFTEINKIIPKKQNMILFFSTTTLYDNSEAVFHYLLEHSFNNKYQIICAVCWPKIYKYNLKNIKFIHVFHSIWYILRSKYVFYHNEMLAIMPSQDQIFVDFWHASTFKKINKMIDPDYKYDFFTYLTVTSELFRPIFAEAFGCCESRIIINGHPRNDYLFQQFDSLKLLHIDRNHYKKIFIWVPTYRLSANHKQQDTDSIGYTETGLPVFYTIQELEQLNLFLDLHSSLMIIKIHPAQDTSKITKRQFTNIRFLYNQDLELLNIPFYTILPQVDALITDYSSILFDFLLLNRPMAFTVDDIKSYKERRGFVFKDAYKYMPGEKIASSEQFFLFINHCLNNEDSFQEERKSLNKLVNFYKDGNNCERILKFVGITK